MEQGKASASFVIKSLPPVERWFWTGDLNGDDQPDFFGTGQSVSFGSGPDPRWGFPCISANTDVVRKPNVFVADLNQDGQLDLVSNRSANSPLFAFALNTGTGISASKDIALGTLARTEFSAGFVVADVNSDSHPDLVFSTVTKTMSLLAVAIGAGNGVFSSLTFTQLSTYGSPDWEQQIGLAAADFDGDQKIDLVVSGCAGAPVRVFTGDGAGNFRESFRENSGQCEQSIAVGDFNGDGRPDIATGGFAGYGGIRLRLNNGANGFVLANLPDLQNIEPPSALGVGDFNRDGKADLAVATFGAYAYLALGSAAEGLSVPTRMPTYQSAYGSDGVVVADWNRDERPDMLVLDSNRTSILYVGDGRGGFLGRFQVDGFGGQGIAADLNSDGRPDLVNCVYGVIPNSAQ